MIELMLKMTFWLVAAIILGFSMAWLISKIVYHRRFKEKEASLDSLLFERNNMIEKLEKGAFNEKIISEKLLNNFKILEKEVAQKALSIKELEEKLEIMPIPRTGDDSSLEIEFEKLRKLDIERLEELLGFEEVLVMAEEKLEENEKKYKKNISAYEQRINDYAQELKLYKAGKAEAEFIISKDQFLKIEEQLEEYQDEITLLKKENNALKVKYSFTSIDTNTKANTSSLSKVFRETYRKITKS